MKKYLIVLAAAVMALASCSNGGGSKYTSIKFKNAEMTMALGATDKLQVLYEPTSLDAPVCVWASSNAEVVAVDQNGNIEALEIGEANITATYGEGEDQLKAVCKIIVKDPLDMLQWGGWSVWNLDRSTILSNDTVKVTLSTGQEVSCVMIPATYKIWSSDVYLDVDHLAGAGYVVDLEGTALLITDDLGKGPNYHYLGASHLKIVDAKTFNWNDTAFAYCAVAGALGDAATHFEWLNDTVGDVEAQFTGRMYAADLDAGKYIDPFSGIIGEVIFVGDETETLYKSNVSWFGEPQIWGLVATEDYKDIVQPYAWAPLQQKYYEYLGEEAAPRKYTVKEYVEKKETKIARPDVLTHK